MSSSSSQYLSSDQYFSLAYHCLLFSFFTFSHCHLSVDTTQVRTLPRLKFLTPYLGAGGKLKCKDLMVKLVYLSSLIFCKPIFELLPHNALLTLLKSASTLQSLYSSNLFVDVINFLLGTSFPQPSLITWPIPTLPSRITKPS